MHPSQRYWQIRPPWKARSYESRQSAAPGCTHETKRQMGFRNVCSCEDLACSQQSPGILYAQSRDNELLSSSGRQIPRPSSQTPLTSGSRACCIPSPHKLRPRSYIAVASRTASSSIPRREDVFKSSVHQSQSAAFLSTIP